jgi:hypothetical protein
MTRRARITWIAFGTFVFLGISVLLTKALVGSGNERAAILEVLRAEARGDAGAVLAGMPECRRSAACARLVRERTDRLARPGTVQVLNFVPSVQVALTNRRGTARVAWRTDRMPLPVVVQCVVVQRHGPLTGGRVELVSISNPVGLESSCG